MELKRYLELRVKKRVKEQFLDGKFQNLVAKDVYNCIRLNSNTDISVMDDSV